MMPQRNSPRFESDEDKLTAQFTPGQLVIYVCVSLFVILVAFLLGVLVGKYDPSLGDAGSPVADNATLASTQGTQTSPRVPEPVTLPPEPENEAEDRPPDMPSVDLPPLPVAAEPAESPPQVETPPEPPQPSPEPTAPLPPEAVSTAASPPPPQQTESPPLLVPVEPPPEELPDPTPPVTSTTGAEQSRAPAPQPNSESSAPAAPTAPAAPSGYGVQVVSLAGDRRIEGADACQRKLKDQGWDSVVLQYNGGQTYAVVVVGFADRAAANAARDSLRQQREFKDCFVKKLP